MKGRYSYLLMALACIALIAGLAYADAHKCSLCGMNIAGNENTVYEVTHANGKAEAYCCPHCGLWVQGSEKGVKGAKARDFISGEWTDPAKMYFVFKSKAIPACAPSWIAFAKKSEAEMFVKGFGGTMYSFDEALKERMKHPKGMEM